MHVCTTKLHVFTCHFTAPIDILACRGTEYKARLLIFVDLEKKPFRSVGAALAVHTYPIEAVKIDNSGGFKS